MSTHPLCQALWLNTFSTSHYFSQQPGDFIEEEYEIMKVSKLVQDRTSNNSEIRSISKHML